MEYIKVLFLPEDIEIEVALGSTLMEARRLACQSPDAPCGGKGLCNKCIAEVEKNGIWTSVKSCQYVIEQDITVRIPEKGDGLRIITSGIEGKTEFNTLVHTVSFKISKSGLDDARDDRTRLICALAESGDLAANAELAALPTRELGHGYLPLPFAALPALRRMFSPR